MHSSLCFIATVALCMAGCASHRYTSIPTGKSDAEIRKLILGKWFLPVDAAEFDFLKDGTFLYKPGPSNSFFPSSFFGKWQVTNATLHQQWPRIGGNPKQSTDGTILQITSRHLLILSHISSYDDYCRVPKS
jgi:hypothetical protein